MWEAAWGGKEWVSKGEVGILAIAESVEKITRGHPSPEIVTKWDFYGED